MQKVSIEQLINSSYIKYNRLTGIINEVFVGSNASHVNIYIDLYSVLKPIFGNNYAILDYSVISSCVINMCAHYREFFKTRYGVSSTIFIVYSQNNPYINNQFYSGYNEKNYKTITSDKLLIDMVKNNIELLELLCPYLPDIHFIKSEYETGVVIYDLICRQEAVAHVPHLVISKDVYNFQLVTLQQDTIILRPKKSKGEDLSYYINRYNVLPTYLLIERKIKPESVIPTLRPELLSTIMAMAGVKERNIKSVCNISSSLKILHRAIEEQKIINGYNSDPLTLYFNIDNSKLSISEKTFEFRFKAIDIYFQYLVYMNTAECKSIKLNNLYDPETLREINDKHFIKYPLNLNAL